MALLARTAYRITAYEGPTRWTAAIHLMVNELCCLFVKAMDQITFGIRLTCLQTMCASYLIHAD